VSASVFSLGNSRPLLGRRMPDLDLTTADGSVRAFALLHAGRPVLLNLGAPASVDITSWADRVRPIDARYDGPFELPAIGPVSTPTAILIRPDGHVAGVGTETQDGLHGALQTWFGPRDRDNGRSVI
jgi:3-(3-hydroxy-phenyl)propionate hydroxylase